MTDEFGTIDIIHGENLAWLGTVDDGAYDLIYIDPPFNTGRRQSAARMTAKRAEDGDRAGFGGRRYATERGVERGYDDRFDDLPAWLRPRLEQARRVLAEHGSLFVHLDPREAHYVKVLLDELFGRDGFMNEIVWAYDFGGRSRSRWSAKHDTILWYARDPSNYLFDFEAMDRIPYMAPGLVTPEKAARGKTPTDVWWHTIVPTNGAERTGYPTQKPLGVLRRIIAVHSRPGDRVLDFFAGSGTTGEAACRMGRHATLVDENTEAIEVMQRRLAFASPVTSVFPAP